ncbi:MAG: hypothetical protein PWQ57_773 [Desulfovibrionales bacterium]|nr:hypothetical protein [Desulfovibrionales bacterium]
MQHPRLQQEALGLGGDFTAVYMSLRNLRMVVDKHPDAPCHDFVERVSRELMDVRHAGQTNARLMYREAALCLAIAAQRSPDPAVADQAWEALLHCVFECRGVNRTEATAALGEMELDIPRVRERIPRLHPPQAELPRLMDQTGATGPPSWHGRTLIWPSGKNVICLKVLRREEQLIQLARESWWSTWLGEHVPDEDFRPPSPLDVAPLGLILAPGLEGCPNPQHESGAALIYRASPDYFHYPNDERPGMLPDPESFLAMMERAARLCGRTISLGAVHTAIVPLFHNRIQVQRRHDAGVYRWRRPGRLDRWLDSCRHPNFGPTGLRDFEHMKSARSGRNLFTAAVEHMIGLLLTAGSYFRAKNPHLRGFDADGRPVDARDLFDPRLLAQAVKTVVEGYQRGVAGAEPAVLPLGIDALVERMIEEMGVDRHMEEFLRVEDQLAMDEETFLATLYRHGLSPEEAAGRVRGEQDIPLLTGPHLGRFNGTMCLPELVEFSSVSAALCLSVKRRRAAPSSGEKRRV